MKKLKIVWGSDFHIGLKTGEIDRTPEIIRVMLDIVKRAVQLIKKDYEVILVLGGDIFNTNTPSEANISEFIRVLNVIKKYNVKTYIIVGNHDAVSDPARLSCMNFVRKIKVGYPTLTLIDDIKFLKIGVYDTGPLYFTFLPHISKATLASKNEDKLSTQQYIETTCDRIIHKVGMGSQHIVFSHLNVRGVHGGSEENLLKKSEVYLPSAFTNTQHGFVEPTIVQAHIHSEFIDGNVHGIGSPIYCGFGERESEKYFAVITPAINLGDSENIIKLIPTKCTAFKELELNMMNETEDFFALTKVKKFLKTAPSDSIIKFDISINPESNNYDWNSIRKKVETKLSNCTVRPIQPRVLLKRPVRSVEQKITLSPKEAVKVHLTKNLRKDKRRAARIYKLSHRYMEL